MCIRDSHPAPLYPVVPGRLIMINDEPVRQLVTKESRGERAIQRDLSLTWACLLYTSRCV